MAPRQSEKKRPTVVIGLLGPTLDQGHTPARWNRWRPTVALGQMPDLLIDRLELLYQSRNQALLDQVVADLTELAPETEIRPVQVELDNPWDFEEVFDVLYAYAHNARLKPEEEDYLLHVTTGTHVIQICLFLLTESRHLPGRLLQTSPPRGEERVGRWHLIDLDLSRYDRIARRFEVERQESLSVLKAGIETRNADFNRLIERIERVALVSDAPLLITGPTGAGKTRLAERIYALRKARNLVSGAYVEVNCATLKGDTAMATLFGHTAGAFTGARQVRPGLLRTADEGVLFLDEIGELGLDEQAMLLRALESGTFMPVGADTPVESRFQLIAGTNRDLRAQVVKGRFREDLLARIDLWTFDLPGLKQRPEDIEPNLDYELERLHHRTGRRVRMNAEARAAFLAFATGPRGHWRANFRDLGAAVIRMTTLAEGDRVTEAEVTEEIGRLEHGWQATASQPTDPDEAAVTLLKPLLGAGVDDLDRFDRVQLADVVRICRTSASLSAAGRRLFAASRARRKTVNDADRLKKYLARFDLSWAEISVQR